MHSNELIMGKRKGYIKWKYYSIEEFEILVSALKKNLSIRFFCVKIKNNRNFNLCPSLEKSRTEANYYFK